MTRERVLLWAGLLGLCTTTWGCRPAPEAQGTHRTPATETAKEATGEHAQAWMIRGHKDTVRCLRAERATTDGDELRCEDWGYVQKNYNATH